MPDDFHEVRFPVDVALGASGGPVRRTDIVTLGSGREHRNARWAQARRRYDAGLGIRDLDALHAVVTFFEERRGRLIGFRFRDPVDCRSGPPSRAPSATDVALGEGDGVRTTFSLLKLYGTGPTAVVRRISKPVAGTVRVAVAGAELGPSAFACDPATGTLVLTAPAPSGAAVAAGFEFDVPVRFDTDALSVDLSAFAAGAVPSIPLIEILP